MVDLVLAWFIIEGQLFLTLSLGGEFETSAHVREDGLLDCVGCLVNPELIPDSIGQVLINTAAHYKEGRGERT